MQGSEKGKIGEARQFPSQATIRDSYGDGRRIFKGRAI